VVHHGKGEIISRVCQYSYMCEVFSPKLGILVGRHYKALPKIWSCFEQNSRSASYSCIYKGISEKYKGKSAIIPFLLYFLAGS
jgi:hypothetical protein